MQAWTITRGCSTTRRPNERTPGRSWDVALGGVVGDRPHRRRRTQRDRADVSPLVVDDGCVGVAAGQLGVRDADLGERRSRTRRNGEDVRNAAQRARPAGGAGRVNRRRSSSPRPPRSRRVSEAAAAASRWFPQPGRRRAVHRAEPAWVALIFAGSVHDRQSRLPPSDAIVRPPYDDHARRGAGTIGAWAQVACGA